MWGFMNLTKIMRFHISVYVHTHSFCHEPTQSFMHLVPGPYIGGWWRHNWQLSLTEMFYMSTWDRLEEWQDKKEGVEARESDSVNLCLFIVLE